MYLYQGLFNTQEYKIHKFIHHNNNIVEYLEHFLPFIIAQGLPYEKITKIAEFALTREWQKKIPVQEFESASKSTNKLVEFCEYLEMSVDIIKEFFYGTQPKKIRLFQWYPQIILSGFE